MIALPLREVTAFFSRLSPGTYGGHAVNIARVQRDVGFYLYTNDVLDSSGTLCTLASLQYHADVS